ncbi:glycosyltransferase family 2 protein [Swaminathania salitolerans]|uniref:Glycosyl transferase family 2 n=1 Tax=Swaminathania salitolerans TaxID=182838 RepID=A0A511BRM1_9PROT|nr:glycosyltransferase family 2 protein [Swaminathania salitolerans]GBQ14311.1 hypothetical protein AA21291_1794 [Swaminathania salitolerans LMG 21291]GEL02986.1 hypothetical protein SSA02_21490 [Swaminathania salitolerans]
MMQRDEGPLLMAWLGYYARIFGFDALTIFDNGSVDPLTLHLLDHARRCGATIRYDCSDPADFHGKGQHLGAQIREWDRTGSYDFALPVDCDEFLAVVEDDGVSTSAGRILAEFARLRPERRALRIGSSLFNHPARPGWFSVDRAFIKGFLPARSIALIDNGQHTPASRLESGYALSRFTYLHWHNHGFAEMQRRARLKLANSLIDPDDRDALLRYAATPNMPGQHLVGILLAGEDSYLRRYEGTPCLVLNWARSPSDLSSAMEDGPVMFPDGPALRRWSGSAYERINPDVKGWPLGPLMHFLLHGHAEGRRF